MLRALLLGILASSAVAACKGKGDASAVAVGSAAGKVVSVSGPVEATRGGATRQLATGTEIFADDEVKTGADATVEIELFHNHAKWSLTANKQGRVDASLAWGMDKQEASKTVEHNTAAAGREAERSAAETSATAAEERKKEAKEAPKPMAAPVAPMTESMPAPGAPSAPTAGEGEAGGGGLPPPPPPPPPKPAADQMDEEKEVAPKTETKSAPRQIAQGGKSSSGDKGGAPKDEPEKMKVVISPQTLADKHKPEFAKCFDANTHATISIDFSAKQTTTITNVKVTTKQRQCVSAVVSSIDWPSKTFRVTVKL